MFTLSMTAGQSFAMLPKPAEAPYLEVILQMGGIAASSPVDAGEQGSMPAGWTPQRSRAVAEATAEALGYDVAHFVKVVKVENAPLGATALTRARHTPLQASTWTRTRRALARAWLRVVPGIPVPLMLRDASPRFVNLAAGPSLAPDVGGAGAHSRLVRAPPLCLPG